MTDSLDLFGGVEMPTQPGGHREEADHWRARVSELLADKHELERQLEDMAAHVDSIATVLEDHYGFACKKYRHSRTLAAVIKRGWKREMLEQVGSPVAIKRWLDRHERDRRPLPAEPGDLIFCYLKDARQKALHEGVPKSESEEDA